MNLWLVPPGTATNDEACARLEIARAKRAGLDGFVFDAWAGGGPARQLLDVFFKVVEEDGTDFALTICFDADCHRPNDKSRPMHEKFAESARQFLAKHGDSRALARRDGKPLLFTYHLQHVIGRDGPWEWKDRRPLVEAGWEEFRRLVGEPIYLHGCIDGIPGMERKGSLRYEIADWAAHHFEAVGGFLGVAGDWRLDPKVSEVVKAAGAEWSQPVFPQYANHGWWIYSQAGYDTYRNNWQAACDTGSTLIQVVTWNDYGEDTAIAPNFGSNYTTLRLTRHLVDQWKSGLGPVVERDEVHACFRRAVGTPDAFPFQSRRIGRLPDVLEILTFLTAPGRVEVPGYGTYDAPSGFHSRQFPLHVGMVAANVIRDGRIACGFTSPEEVSDRRWREDSAMQAFGSNYVDEWAKDFPGTKPLFYSENGDADGDGLPNWFEMVYFGKWPRMETATVADPADDPDGDGATNMEEFLRRTDPTKADAPYGPGMEWSSRMPTRMTERTAWTEPSPVDGVFNPERDQKGNCVWWWLTLKNGRWTPAGDGDFDHRDWAAAKSRRYRAGHVFTEDGRIVVERRGCERSAVAWESPVDGVVDVCVRLEGGQTFENHGVVVKRGVRIQFPTDFFEAPQDAYSIDDFRVTLLRLLPDDSSELSARIASSPAGGTVELDARDYHLSRAVVVEAKTNLVVRGRKGTRLLLRFDPAGDVKDNADGFRFVRCANVLLENLTFTTDRPVNASGRVAAVDAALRTYDVRVEPEFPITGREHILGIDTFDESGTPDYVLETYEKRPVGAEYEVVGEQTVRLKAPSGYDLTKLDVGHRILFRHEIPGNCVLEFNACRGVTLRDIEIERAMSAGTVISPPSADFTFERYNIRPPKGSKALFAENSDGIHIIGMSGSLVLRDCHFDGLGDDCLNIHGRGGEVKEFDAGLGRLACICRGEGGRERAFPQQWASPGDRLVVYDKKTLLEKGRLSVRSFSANGTAMVVPPDFGISTGDYLANENVFASVRVSGCTFANNRARALLLQTENVEVEDCRFRGIALPAVLVAPDMVYWNEVGPSRNVAIRNCLFEKCALHPTHGGCLGAVAFKTTHGRPEKGDFPPGVHRDVRIVGNTFVDCPRGSVFLSSVSGGEVSGNTAVRCGGKLPTCVACEGVSVAGASTVGVEQLSDPPSPFAAQCRGRRPLVVNGDNDHYYKTGQMHRFLPLRDRLTREGPRRYLDAIASAGKVTHFFACAVGQRADYDSSACDPIWLAIDEAVSRGEKPDEWPVNAKMLHDLGVDPFAEWCAYGRKIGVSVWISQRMNDVHHVHLPWNMRTNRFWYDHPELHRSHGVDKSLLAGDWTDEALNYAFPEVREFEFAIFRELVDRYDADGFELDFMRFWRHLTPGREREEAPVLTEFIRRCRAYADEKATSRGHAILLSTRVPSDYASARAFGFDPETWAREGLVDMIAVANFWASEDFDFGFDEWKRRIAKANPKVVVLPCACDNLSSGAARVCTTTVEALRGWADNAYALGAEGLYFFNAAYMPDSVQQEIYDAGFDRQSVAASARRHVVTYHDCVPQGMPDGRQLPIALDKGGAVRVRVGSVPDGRDVVDVIIAGDGMTLAQCGVRLNGVAPLKAAPLAGDFSKYGHAESAATVAFPASALKAGVNVVRFEEPAGTGNVTWVEIGVAKRKRRLCKAIGGDEK